ncbi:hypothetical protein K466DRAFT_583018 [Polyporus arcularius HHB13444]|uniref:Heterokaryon incompatibility domain-containing protein n=1 Tax=Polyporus arcularius HHB13444 TaxID=1314778 RepID=A0A5C3PNR9_9APHY|nr:hypothetical protein K466DRAFT_583018 [Polyporus arcularius HHB13444]
MEMRLMIETEAPADGLSRHSTIAAAGRYWTLSDPLDISGTLPRYACASYVWGDDRLPNPVHPSIMMSDRTLPTFAAVARHAPECAIWIDAFCVPVEPSKKRPTLESLGFIFSRADCVVAVLASQSLAAVREMDATVAEISCENPPADLSRRPLDTLDADMWIRSVWTYQEVVNNPSVLWFASTEEDDAAIVGLDVLKAVGGYMLAYTNLSPQHADIHYRNVLDFEILLADWQMGPFTRRSAFLIMSGVDNRTFLEPANYFYSMIGALTTTPSSRTTDPTAEGLAERFMELCEEKGDYSFIFSARPRDARPGLRWRPLPGILRPVLTWHSWGEGQPGRRVDGGVLLENVAVFTPVPAEEHDGDAFWSWARVFVERWIYQFAEGEDRAALTLGALKDHVGFIGTGPMLLTERGAFYAQDRLPAGDISICVSIGVRWTFGAPGIAKSTCGGEISYTPGVFVGDVRPQVATSSNFVLQ